MTGSGGKGKGRRRAREAAELVREVARRHGVPLRRLSRRVTVAHADTLAGALAEVEAEEARYPGADVRVSGGQGSWRVRRDRVESDPERVHVRERRRSELR